MTAPPNSAILSAQSLVCRRGGRQLFDGLSFELNSGELLQVTGPNGSGKTTLLRILCGLRAADSGQVFWGGRSIDEVDDDYRGQLAYLGFHSGVKLELTPLENLEFSAGLAATVCLTPDEALDRTGLSAFANRACRQLSSGQIRRVALARLLMQGSPLWILDEPLTGLDRGAREDFETALFARAKNGGRVVLTSHHPLSDHGGLLRRLELGS